MNGGNAGRLSVSAAHVGTLLGEILRCPLRMTGRGCGGDFITMTGLGGGMCLEETARQVCNCPAGARPPPYGCASGGCTAALLEAGCLRTVLPIRLAAAREGHDPPLQAHHKACPTLRALVRDIGSCPRPTVLQIRRLPLMFITLSRDTVTIATFCKPFPAAL